MNCVSIKPFDTALVKKIADNVNVIVTVENHSITGGLYGCVAETLASGPHKAVVKAVGLNDRFSQSGTCDDLKKEFGITAENIVSLVEGNI